MALCCKVNLFRAQQQQQQQHLSHGPVHNLVSPAAAGFHWESHKTHPWYNIIKHKIPEIQVSKDIIQQHSSLAHAWQQLCGQCMQLMVCLLSEARIQASSASMVATCALLLSACMAAMRAAS
jgi:hypothetical protein